ncbi:MAG: hypothetical protein JWR19_1605 [Pedosphaera sp.]|nr:hypothetical protein [Pedosphaera sp.]
MSGVEKFLGVTFGTDEMRKHSNENVRSGDMRIHLIGRQTCFDTAERSKQLTFKEKSAITAGPPASALQKILREISKTSLGINSNQQ